MPTNTTKSDAFEWNSTPEIFNFGFHSFDVAKAKELIRSKKPRKVESMSIEGVSDLVGDPPAEDGSRTLRALGVVVNWDRIMTMSDEIDLDFPTILVPWRDSFLPIDGWHRVAKAKVVSRSALPCVRLTKAELKQILL